MNFKTQIPDFLTEKKFLYLTVIFITVFSVLFMFIYSMFSSTAWFTFSHEKQFLSTLFFYIVSILFLFFSKNLFYDIQKKKPFTYFSLLIYTFIEIIIISLFYVAFTMLASNGAIKIMPILIKSFICITLITIIPLTIAFQYATIKGLNKALREQAKIHNESRLINLRDLKGKIKLSVAPNCILYVTSEDNYVKVTYEQAGRIENVMIRTTTKNLEEYFGEGLIRCHRSYLVNIVHIKLFNNDRENMYIVLDNDNVNQIPVSRSYREAISDALGSRK